MHLDDLPSRPQNTHGLRALPSLPPKKRCKAAILAEEENSADSVIIPFYNPANKPMRFHRSGQPFQVWKEAKPHWQEAAAPKSEAHASLTESLQVIARIVTGPWQVHHSP